VAALLCFHAQPVGHAQSDGRGAGQGEAAICRSEALEGVRGTYRKSDLHWTERGHEVVAERLAQALLSLR
jgi:hypothetical protein